MFALPRQHFGQRGKTEGTRARSAQWAVELARDVVVNPAGVTHKNEGASLDLLVVGAYPRGQTRILGVLARPITRAPYHGSPRSRCAQVTRFMAIQGR